MRYLSPYNAALAQLQRPSARILLSAQKWLSFDRIVKEESRPVMILLPFSPVDFVFDINDTVSLNKPLWESENELIENIRHQLISKPNAISKQQWDNLYYNMALYGILEDTTDAEEGRQHKVSVFLGKEKRATKVDALFVIKDCGKRKDREKVYRLCKEISHLLCHHIPAPNGKEWSARRMNETARVFEAETVAKLVCDHYGIKSDADGYLCEYVNSHDVIPKSVSPDYVLAAAVEIIQMVQGKIPVDKSLLFKCDKSFQTKVLRLKNKKRKATASTVTLQDYPVIPGFE